MNVTSTYFITNKVYDILLVYSYKTVLSKVLKDFLTLWNWHLIFQKMKFWSQFRMHPEEFWSSCPIKNSFGELIKKKKLKIWGANSQNAERKIAISSNPLILAL